MNKDHNFSRLILMFIFIALLLYIFLKPVLLVAQEIGQEVMGSPFYNSPGVQQPAATSSQEEKEISRGWLERLFLKLVGWILEGVAFFLKWIALLVFQVLMNINLYFVSGIADRALSESPFYSNSNVISPAEQIWFVLKTFAYLILVFSALSAGFLWILGEDNNAKSLIFNIIMVALLIDFTFLFIKEAFEVINNIEEGITGDMTIIKSDGSVVKLAASKLLGSLIVSAAWSVGNDMKANIDQIVSNSSNIPGGRGSIGDAKTMERIKNSLISVGTHLFLVVFAMIIFIVLVVMIVLGFARYLILTFLAAVSSFAVATLAFPKFKPPFDAITSMVSGVFDSWFRYVASWLLVVPVFAIMLILGLIIQKSFVSIQSIASVNDAMQFVMSLLIILGWFVLALYITVKMSGKVGEFAMNFGTGALKWAGVTMGGAAAGRVISSFMGKKLGNWADRLEKRSGLNWWGRRMYNVSKLIKQTSQGLLGKAYEETAEIARFKLKKAASALERARTDEEKKKASEDLLGIMRNINKDSELAKMTKEEIKALSGYALEKMSDDRNISQEFLSIISQMDSETQEGVLSRISNDTAKKLVLHMEDKTFSDKVNSLSPIILDGLGKKLGQLDIDGALDILSNSEVMTNLPEILKSGINKATKGLAEALLNKEIGGAIDVLSNLSREAFKKFGTIIDSMKNYGLSEKQQQTIIAEAFKRNADEIIEGMNRASTAERQKFQTKINEAFRSNPDVLRLMSDNGLRNIMRLVDDDIIDQQLTDEQKRRLGIFQGPKIITASS